MEWVQCRRDCGEVPNGQGVSVWWGRIICCASSAVPFTVKRDVWRATYWRCCWYFRSSATYMLKNGSKLVDPTIYLQSFRYIPRWYRISPINRMTYHVTDQPVGMRHMAVPCESLAASLETIHTLPQITSNKKLKSWSCLSGNQNDWSTWSPDRFGPREDMLVYALT